MNPFVKDRAKKQVQYFSCLLKIESFLSDYLLNPYLYPCGYTANFYRQNNVSSTIFTEKLMFSLNNLIIWSVKIAERHLKTLALYPFTELHILNSIHY